MLKVVKSPGINLIPRRSVPDSVDPSTKAFLAEKFGFKTAPPITTELVRTWFMDADRHRRHIVPTEAACATLAKHLDFLIEAGTPEIRAAQHLELGNDVLKILQRLEIARAVHAGHYAGHELSNFATQYSESMRVFEEGGRQLLDLINAAQPPLPTGRWGNTARAIAGAAKQAWSQSGRAPRSIGPNQPIVTFTTSSVNFIRVARGESEVSPATVSDVLRGRRQA
jgi:hypothetical protein